MAVWEHDSSNMNMFTHMEVWQHESYEHIHWYGSVGSWVIYEHIHPYGSVETWVVWTHPPIRQCGNMSHMNTLTHMAVWKHESYMNTSTHMAVWKHELYMNSSTHMAVWEHESYMNTSTHMAVWEHESYMNTSTHMAVWEYKSSNMNMLTHMEVWEHESYEHVHPYGGVGTWVIQTHSLIWWCGIMSHIWTRLHIWQCENTNPTHDVGYCVVVDKIIVHILNIFLE